MLTLNNGQFSDIHCSTIDSVLLAKSIILSTIPPYTVTSTAICATFNHSFLFAHFHSCQLEVIVFVGITTKTPKFVQNASIKAQRSAVGTRCENLNCVQTGSNQGGIPLSTPSDIFKP